MSPTTPVEAHSGEEAKDDPSSPAADEAQVSSLSSSAAAAAAANIGSKELRHNLMRELQDRDPLFYYEVISVLGVGSMGSVAKVRKRNAVIGGSARTDLQHYFSKEKRLNKCFSLPLVGGFFQFCMKGSMEKARNAIAVSDESNHVDSSSSSVLMPHAHHRVEDYNDLHGEAEEEEKSGQELQQLYAMKSIHLSRVTDKTFVEELKNEIHILRTLDHPHIVRPIETFYHRNQIFIVMELCTGGDLYSRDPYTEEEAARITSSILSAISYMHSKNILHRDLKYENIIFVNNSPRAEVKLIDFGLSKVFGAEELTEGVGTIYTMSPEVLKGSYTKQADVWSVGVIAYMLLSSQMPFYGRKRRHIVEQIMAGKYEFKGRRWKRISAQAKEFVQNLLVVDPDERMTADEAFSMAWLNRRFAATVRNPYTDEVDNAQKSLMRFANYSKLKKVALMVIAHKSTSEEIGILRKVFEQYDTERNGILSYDEFKHAFDAAGFPEEDCRHMFDAVDLDGSGKIRYTEFLAATIEAQGAISEQRIAEAFDRLDADDSGFISARNLRDMLGRDFPKAEIDAIIKEADITKDGKISYAEFLALWEDQNENVREEVFKEFALIGADSDVSDVSDEVETGESGEVVSRANFIEHKIISERRAKEEYEMEKKGKHVLFEKEVVTIPDVVYEKEGHEDKETTSAVISATV